MEAQRVTKQMKSVLIFITLCLTVMAEQANVEFWRNSFTLHCPFQTCKWKDPASNEKELQIDNIVKNKVYIVEDDESSAQYFFFVKGKMCENCYELDGSLVAGVIIGDLLMTGGIAILIYHWAQRKSGSSATGAATRPAARNTPRGPAVPNRDYEVLNPRTRENATYAVAGVQKAN